MLVPAIELVYEVEVAAPVIFDKVVDAVIGTVSTGANADELVDAVEAV